MQLRSYGRLVHCQRRGLSSLCAGTEWATSGTLLGLVIWISLVRVIGTLVTFPPDLDVRGETYRIWHQ